MVASSNGEVSTGVCIRAATNLGSMRRQRETLILAVASRWLSPQRLFSLASNASRDLTNKIHPKQDDFRSSTSSLFKEALYSSEASISKRKPRLVKNIADI